MSDANDDAGQPIDPPIDHWLCTKAPRAMVGSVSMFTTFHHPLSDEGRAERRERLTGHWGEWWCRCPGCRTRTRAVGPEEPAFPPEDCHVCKMLSGGDGAA